MAGAISIKYRSGFAVIATIAMAIGIASAPSREASAAALLVEADTGQVISADAADHLWYPASLTKMMTIYVAFAEIKAGRLSFSDQITVSRKAATVSPVRFGLTTGQSITVRQAIDAAIVTSANDAAVALAERIGGTEEKFADVMTLVARRLGMTRTIFRNATGLPNKQQVTTAHDMAVLAMAILHDYPEHYALFNQRSVTIAGKKRPTVNSILGAYEGADGFKTGFTCGSGYNLVASVLRGNRRVIGIVLGSGSRQQRLSEMIKLLDFAFEPHLPTGVPLASLLVHVADGQGAPTVLTGASCLQDDTGMRVAAVEEQPNWRLILGSYTDKAKAQMALADARRRLTTIENAGMTVITPTLDHGVTRYGAVIVGLTRSNARTACETLSQMKVTCHMLGPDPLDTVKLD